MTASRIAIPAITLLQFPWLRWALEPCAIGAVENPLFHPDAIAGWGDKTSASYARFCARLRKVPYLTLEDGFFRSVGLGKARAPSVSCTLDGLGVYFDARQPSDLEVMLAQPVAPEVEARGRQLRSFVVEHRLSKYNHVPETPVRLPGTPGRRRILLVDQVAGDRSLQGAGANARTFSTMRTEAAALAAEDKADVFIKRHPDVVAGYAAGMLGDVSPPFLPVPEAGPHAILDEVDEVWTVSSQFGFDGLLRGRKVVTFGVPFYAGWGLTSDAPHAAAPFARPALQRRSGHDLTLDALAGIVIGVFPRYFDPDRRQAVSAEEALERLVVWRTRQNNRV